ncbi:sulfur reduction protein DsrE [Leeuwenhoekiella polynyae]|mgnify:CR=1 FL=1|uniref:Sulfur reduction protein DsrE n=1 Tax=Leeuwenhoekiella polynyae TaxID=1550906 RepID=A0A4Q0P465_9FLAO|nr:sulfur reduction protein DsrE [Leeuwenhoekiella polynyae]RXG20339.1 hypothetical protein DSM02_2510 [Leeuwenhoekiella polynyae]
MKFYLFSYILLILSTFNTAKTQAQENQPTKSNYVVLTKKVPQLQPILLTAEALRAEQGDSFGDFQVIICGKEIGDITQDDLITPFIERAKKAGVQIIACGFSLKKFKVSRAAVPSGIKIVENGILHNFRLQHKGYKSLSL